MDSQTPLDHDMNNDQHPYARVLVPGNFFVLQGMKGDGLCNSMDRLPELLIDDSQGARQTAQPVNGSMASTGTRVLPSARLVGGVFPSVASSTLPVAARSIQLYGGHALSTPSTALPVIDPSRLEPAEESPIRMQRSEDEDSFLVVSDENVEDHSDEPDGESGAVRSNSIDPTNVPISVPQTLHSSSLPFDEPLDDRGTTVFGTSPRTENFEALSGEQQAALERWKHDCRTLERLKWQEWKELLVGTAEATQLWVENPWWIDSASGELKVFDAIPSMHGAGAVVVGTLPPGTSVAGTELVTLDLESWDVVDATPKDVAAVHDDTVVQKLYSQGRTRWIQFLKVEQARESHQQAKLTGFSVLSWNGYSYMAAGSPLQYVNPDHWIWRVTSPVGAFVREGLDLSTRRIAIIPYGHLLVVKGKTVNAMGLSRLQVAYLNDSGDVVTGWCSEQMNPLSGRRDSILQPLPMPVPALYRVVFSDGAIIRSGVELSTTRIGLAAQNTVLCVTTRCFSQHPTDRCLQRMRLAGDGGWISSRLSGSSPEQMHVVSLERIDESFDPSFPGHFHVCALQQVYREKIRSHEAARRRERRRHPAALPSSLSRLSPDLSSVDESVASAADDAHHVRNDDDNGSNSSTSSADGGPAPSIYSPAVARHLMRGDTGSLRGYGTVRHPFNKEESCLICLCDERTATIVHGETGHIACCLTCARILKARHDNCPVCRLPIDAVIQHFWA